MKKLLILYATYGTGHKAIANYVEEYFSKTGKYEIKKIDILNYSKKILGAISEKYSYLTMSYTPRIWDLIYYSTDNKILGKSVYKLQSLVFNDKKLKKAILDFNPDVIINTYFFTATYISNLKKAGILDTRLVTIVTDYYAHQIWLDSYKSEDALIVSSIEDKKKLVSKGVIASHIIKPYGIPLSDKYVKKLYDRSALMKKFGLTGERPIILYYAGGGKGALSSLPYFLTLVQSKIDADIFFVCGKNKELFKRAEGIVKRHGLKNIKVLGFINNGPEYMTVADFVITKPGGITVTECLCFNKPMILTKGNGGQESANYRYLTKSGYAINANNLFKFKIILKKLISNPKYLEKLEKNLKKVDREDSMKKVYDLVDGYFKDEI